MQEFYKGVTVLACRGTTTLQLQVALTIFSSQMVKFDVLISILHIC
jgi:hypothetical protein